MNLRTGMSAGQTGEGKRDAHAGSSFRLNRKAQMRTHSAGASDREDSFLLRINVEEIGAVQFIGGQSGRTVHAGFLIDGQDNCQRRKRNPG